MKLFGLKFDLDKITHRILLYAIVTVTMQAIAYLIAVIGIALFPNNHGYMSVEWYMQSLAMYFVCGLVGAIFLMEATPFDRMWVAPTIGFCVWFVFFIIVGEVIHFIKRRW